MKILKVTILIFFILISSCKAHKNFDINGVYVSKNTFNFMDYILLRYRIFNDTIWIFENGKYIEKSCMVSYGKWKREGNSLFLYRDSIKYQIDSFNYKHPYDTMFKQKDTIRFKITSKRLVKRKNLRHILELIKKDTLLSKKNLK